MNEADEQAIDGRPISPALAEIDGEFNLYGQQIQHKERELQQLREDRLRLQGRWAQREADEVEITALRTKITELSETLSTVEAAHIARGEELHTVRAEAGLERCFETAYAELQAVNESLHEELRAARAEIERLTARRTRTGGKKQPPTPAADAAQEQNHG